MEGKKDGSGRQGAGSLVRKANFKLKKKKKSSGYYGRCTGYLDTQSMRA